MAFDITLRGEERLFVGSLQISVKRSHIANFLGILLIILTISLAGAGYVTYQNLEEIVSKLETDDRSNINLLQYKEILVNLHDMENQVESYELTSDPKYIERYNRSISRVFARMDSINALNQNDTELLIFNDSLRSLINEKTFTLNQLIDFRSNQEEDEFKELEGFLDAISSNPTPPTQAGDTAKLDEPEPEEKKGFFKRLLAKKPETVAAPEINQDSIILAEKKQYHSQINTKVDQMRSSQRLVSQRQREKEMDLLSAHFGIQNQIIDLVTFLESRETTKVKIKAIKAKELANNTSQQITLFFTLATLLLLSSVIMMVTYVQRNSRYQELLRESKNSAETLAKAKERFFANMSHEIRTPMNAISGFTKVLLRTELKEEQKEQVQIIHKSSEHLLRLLNDILDFSKLQAEKLQLESTPFSIRQVCEDSITLLKASADHKGLKLYSTLEDVPEYVLGDPHRLRQIMLNLLNNGIKYTEKGEVALLVSGERKQNKFHLSLEVKDTGVGISKDHQLRLFQEFEQANQSSFSKGTGLGLAITKRLVNLHHGSIRLDSKEGDGTSVFVKMVYPLTDKKPAEDSVKETKHDFQGVHVLIADDEPFNTKLLTTLLEKKQITFDVVHDGTSALKLAMAHPYHMLLLDLKMPGYTGWELLEEIKSTSGPNQSTPMIALTATITSLDKSQGTAFRFDHIMRKPFEETELFEAIASALHISPTVETRAKNVTDLSALMQMGDQQFVQDMVETFINGAQEGLLQIRSALKNEAYEDISLIAHRIVAPARHFKAGQLVDLLKNLEKRADNRDSTISEADLNLIQQELDHVIASLKSALQAQIFN